MRSRVPLFCCLFFITRCAITICSFLYELRIIRRSWRLILLFFFPALHLHTEWEEVREGAMQRKRQLEGTLADGRGFEERRREVESFLSRLQARLDRMPPVGQTLDILEAQLKEQKVRWLQSKNYLTWYQTWMQCDASLSTRSCKYSSSRSIPCREMWCAISSQDSSWRESLGIHTWCLNWSLCVNKFSWVFSTFRLLCGHKHSM